MLAVRRQEILRYDGLTFRIRDSLCGWTPFGSQLGHFIPSYPARDCPVAVLRPGMLPDVAKLVLASEQRSIEQRMGPGYSTETVVAHWHDGP